MHCRWYTLYKWKNSTCCIQGSVGIWDHMSLAYVAMPYTLWSTHPLILCPNQLVHNCPLNPTTYCHLHDGALVMSGCCKGAQTQSREVALHAIYIHCNAHLCLVDSTKAVRGASEFFGLLETLYVFLTIEVLQLV